MDPLTILSFYLIDGVHFKILSCWISISFTISVWKCWCAALLLCSWGREWELPKA